MVNPSKPKTITLQSTSEGLSAMTKHMDQLNSLLLIMNLTAEKLDSTDMKTLITLAQDLAGDTACWLLEQGAINV